MHINVCCSGTVSHQTSDPYLLPKIHPGGAGVVLPRHACPLLPVWQTHAWYSSCGGLSWYQIWSISCSVRLHLFDQYVVKTFKYYCNSKWLFSIFIYFTFNLFLWGKAECSASLRQSSVSNDPSEIILISCFIYYFQCWKQLNTLFVFLRILWRIERCIDKYKSFVIL